MENKDQATPQTPPNPTPNTIIKHRPTLTELVGTSAFIILSTLIAIWLFANEFKEAEAYKFSAAVKWSNSTKYNLKAGPSWFVYLQSKDSLLVTQAIDDDGKEKLLGLYNPDSTGFNTYKIAVEELTFHSNTLPKPSYLLTLLIGGLAAVIGVQIRTIHRFVFRACYVQDMNIHVWWPWYVMRPIIGFLLGCTVVLLAQVNLLTVTGDKSSLYFWIGFAVLAGFGTPDVVDKLHQLSLTLFGTKSSNESGNDAELVSSGNNADPNSGQGGGK